MKKLREITEGKRDPDRALAIMTRANKIKQTDFSHYNNFDDNDVHSFDKNQIPTRKFMEYPDLTKFQNYEKPYVDHIPLHRISTDQHQVNHAVVAQKIKDVWWDKKHPELIKLAHYHGPDDHHYIVSEGNHDIEAARYKGLKTMPAIILGEIPK